MKKTLSPIILLVILLSGCRSSIVDDPTTTVRYSVPEEAHVIVTVENSYDTVILKPVDADLQAGIYLVSFDASHLPEGIYYFIVDIRGKYSSNHTSTTRKLLLIK